VTLSPEACSPDNVERLLAQIERGEEALAAEKEARAADIKRIKAAMGMLDEAGTRNDYFIQAVGGDPMKWLLDLLGEMSRVYRLQPPSDAKELEQHRVMRASAEKAYARSSARCEAYQQFISDVMTLARQRDLEVIWIKGAQLLKLHDKLLENPNA
jgi:hypothetical protein